MKKVLALVLALAMVFSFGAVSFAATDTVTGTLADGTVISKPVSEVLLSSDAALAQNDSLKAFFESAAADPNTISYGAVALGGFFSDITEDTVDVPLSAPGTKAGDKVTVTLSDGSSANMVCKEAGVVVVAFPKDADVVGYAVASVKTIPWVAPAKEPEGSEWEVIGSYSGDGWTRLLERNVNDGRIRETDTWDHEDSKGNSVCIYDTEYKPENLISEDYYDHDYDYDEINTYTYRKDADGNVTWKDEYKYSDGRPSYSEEYSKVDEVEKWSETYYDYDRLVVSKVDQDGNGICARIDDKGNLVGPWGSPEYEPYELK